MGEGGEGTGAGVGIIHPQPVALRCEDELGRSAGHIGRGQPGRASPVVAAMWYLSILVSE